MNAKYLFSKQAVYRAVNLAVNGESRVNIHHPSAEQFKESGVVI